MLMQVRTKHSNFVQYKRPPSWSIVVSSLLQRTRIDVFPDGHESLQDLSFWSSVLACLVCESVQGRTGAELQQFLIPYEFSFYSHLI